LNRKKEDINIVEILKKEDINIVEILQKRRHKNIVEILN
jgi:hypothetical protein